MYNFRLGLVTLAAPLMLFSCSKEQNNTPAPTGQEQTASATQKERSLATAAQIQEMTNTINSYVDADAPPGFLALVMVESPQLFGGRENTGKLRDNTGKLDDYRVGTTNQNWYMIRSARNPAFPNGGGGQNQYKSADRLKADKKLEIQSFLLGVQRYGLDKYLAGHRNGQAGLDNPNTADIKAYKNYYNWLKGEFEKGPGPGPEGVNQRTAKTYYWGGTKIGRNYSYCKYLPGKC